MHFRWNQFVARHRYWPFVAVFLALNLIVTQDGGQNTKSRLYMMRSMSENFSFRIDDHIRTTDDWSLAPDGHHYSNKAPGPALLGFPVFYVVDQLTKLKEKGYRDERGLRHDPGYTQNTFTSLFMQSIPFGLVCLFAVAWLAHSGYSPAAQVFFLLAALFGNTAVLFMNSYFGHGFIAMLQLGGLLALLKRRWLLAGAAFSATLLSDYGFTVQIPALLAAIAVARPSKRDFGQFSLGALPAAALWIWYHTVCFGSPLAIASKFQNPTFLDAADGPRMWGMLYAPDASILSELLIGGSRGLWLSQPWLYLTVPAAIFLLLFRRRGSGLAVTAAFCLLSLFGLVIMNASFNGWHGGATAGPRYLSGVLPACALLAALVLDRLPPALRAIQWASLGVGLVFRSFVYGGTILAPNANLWRFFWDELHTRATPVLRVGIFWVLLVAAGMKAQFSKGPSA